MKRIWIFLCVLYGCSSTAQSFLKDSKPYIKPFDQLDAPILMDHIDQIADQARIVGLGEVSHYTKECYQLKHQIIKKLIEKGFQALVLEVDFGQALLWNAYVTKGEGDLDQLVA